MKKLVILLNWLAILILMAVFLRYLLAPVLFWGAPFAMALVSLTRRQIASFHQATLIANAVALMFGTLALTGLGEDPEFVDTTWQELLVVMDVLFYMVTPVLNLIWVRRIMRTESAETRPE